MKKFYLNIAFVFTSVLCLAQVPNLAYKNEITINNGIAYYKGALFTGVMFEQYDNGKKKFETNYKSGLKEGNEKLFDSGGKIIYECTFKNGSIVDGNFIEFYENGKYKYKKTYKDGLRNGDQFYWHENGKLETYRLTYFAGEGGDDSDPVFAETSIVFLPPVIKKDELVEDDYAPVGEIFTIVDQMPEFPNGVEALYKYLSTNIKYPNKCKESGISGKVYISFIIGLSGKISNVQVLKGIECANEEAVRVVNNMPSWQPGKMNGNPVKVRYTLPIKFIPNY